jgi:hypothetical protein
LDRGEAFDVTDAVQVFTWCIHFWYTRVLSSQIAGSLRGPWPVLSAWFLSLLAATIQCRSDILSSRGLATPQDIVIFVTAIVAAAANGLYGLSLLPPGEETRSQYQVRIF